MLNEGTITIGLDTRITEKLMEEGIVRDLVRNIQNLRKEKGLDVTDRIDLFLSADEAVAEAVENYTDYLLTETLANSIQWKKTESSLEYECGEYRCYIELQKS